MKKTLNCAGRLIDLSQPAVMGILNVTPDSFYDGGRHMNTDAALRRAEEMINSGAQIIDVGGCSTRPGSAEVPAEEEIRRVIPVTEALHKTFPGTVISIDSYNAEVIEKALDAGATMVNDVMGGNEQKFGLAAAYNAPYVIMHNAATAASMHQTTEYADIISEISDSLIKKATHAKACGVKDIILDPGFGFAKSLEQNYVLLQKISIFSYLGYPVLCGISRKSMIYKLLNTAPESSLTGTVALNTFALNNGAAILRVHDVPEASQAIQLYLKTK